MSPRRGISLTYALHMHIVYRNASRPFLNFANRVAGTIEAPTIYGNRTKYVKLYAPFSSMTTFSTHSNMPNSLRSGFTRQPEYN